MSIHIEESKDIEVNLPRKYFPFRKTQQISSFVDIPVH